MIKCFFSFQKGTFWGKHVHSNLIFTQNLKFIHADTSAEFLMSALSWLIFICTVSCKYNCICTVFCKYNFICTVSCKYNLICTVSCKYNFICTVPCKCNYLLENNQNLMYQCNEYNVLFMWIFPLYDFFYYSSLKKNLSELKFYIKNRKLEKF